jgi:hypothetical protein
MSEQKEREGVTRGATGGQRAGGREEAVRDRVDERKLLMFPPIPRPTVLLSSIPVHQWP